MNMKGLVHLLERIGAMHPDMGMSMDVINKEGSIEEFRIEVFSFPSIGVRFSSVPATHVYTLTRLSFDAWHLEHIRGG